MDEESGIRARFWHVGADETVLDVGCFVGSYTLPALHAGAYVHAFDAHGTPLLLLRERARREGVNERLTTVRACVSDGDPYPSQLVEQIDPTMTPQGPWLTVDEYVSEHHLRVDWIKVDVEGGELAVLAGAHDTLRDHRPRLIVEEHSLVYGALPAGHKDAVLDRLRGHGYLTYHEVLVGYERTPAHIYAFYDRLVV
jgi:FkbM family methyltransferase